MKTPNFCVFFYIQWLNPRGNSCRNTQKAIFRHRKQYTYTAYTEPEYQGVTDQVPYTGGSTDTYTGKSFDNGFCAITFSPIFWRIGLLLIE